MNKEQIGSHKTSVFTEDGITRIVYHNTAVVKFNNDEIILNSDGWNTVTTKTRMNQASSQFDLGFSVYQKDFEWFVEYHNKTFDYYDGMKLDSWNIVSDVREV